MLAESTDRSMTQESDHMKAHDRYPSRARDDARASREDGRWRPSSEAVGGAIAGGVAGAFTFGPIGALVGMFAGAAIAVATTRHFTPQTR
jgi:hypothetical protein